MDRLEGGKDGEGGREDAGDHTAADEALNGAVNYHLLDIGGRRAEHAGKGEARRRNGKQHARREKPSQKTRKRNHDDFRDQVGDLHPGNFIGAGAKARLNFGERGRDNLDVEDRHEHAEDHGHKADGLFGINAIICRIFSADSAYGGVCGHIDALREEKTAMPGPFRLSGFAIRF
ncbi:hypothetical protein P038_01431 [Brucella abortus 99-9971-135]|nr:hypothetical protein DO78_3136 [Brucella abortus]AIJ62028.1 hypothetical protein DK53_3021 [Brucella abortus bv. 9 str. C68]AIJ65825.1 hypothetical protein DO74_2333 [Brucella abortus bv. 6 str. 870]ENP31119.1 hypothetical protein C084_02849 [Brucella abortus 64/122]ENP43600.1 hypothetical protein C082_02722 [Brucella abortus 80/102]ENP49574.1 hypothetical protein C053_03159 [Brucella abortus 85/140]ENQ08686.1 hypothetical protein C083_02137 [Brucella abortus LEVI237]ENR42862.1 hypothetic